jgi:hypothetical protein
MVVPTPNLVFGVYDGSLLSYSPEDQSIQTYSLLDGLHDINIKHLKYSPEAHALFIAYENSNIDIFMGKNDVYNLADIKNKNISNKIINNVEIIGEYAYLATGFGIVVVDLKRKEIKDTYQLGVNTTAISQWGDYWYAATNDGLRRAPITSNLLDRENWEYLPSLNTANDKAIEKMVTFKDHLLFFDGKSVFSLSNEREEKILFTGMCRQLTLLGNQLIIAVYNAVYFYTDLNARTQTNLDPEYKSINLAYNSEDDYWIAWGAKGLWKINLERGTSPMPYKPLIEAIKVNSPIRNLTFRLTFAEDKLLVTGGGNQGSRFDNPGTFMIYEKGSWYNFDDQAISLRTGIPCRDLMSVAVDPRDPTHYYVSAWGEGVYEFKDTTFVQLYSCNDQSTLQSTSPNSSQANRSVWVDGIAFDRNNNLYVTNSLVEKGLSVLKNNDEWKALPYASNAWMRSLLITRNNQKWISNFRGTVGISVLDDNNTIDNTNDDTYYFSSRFVDQQGTNIGVSTFSCLAEDLNGTVWVGTDNGPISFSSAAQVGDGVCNRVISTDQYDQGYYLLEGQSINAIAVDGGNRKWMGTQGSGVFLVDQSDGTLKVENFNTSNSLLISDIINSIAINNKTGEIFIATDQGLCSYQGEAVEGKPDYSEVYAYPNPVYPSKHRQVVITGLMQDSNIKITDIAGNLIKEVTSNGGQYAWNCTNLKGEIVKAGIYLVFATTQNGSQGVVTKIMVIK